MKFTIITLTLNSEKTILDNIKSINNQNYKNIEHLCLDSYSNDRTIKILNENKAAKRKIIRSKIRGIYLNLNKATSMASGEIVGVLHSDDVFYDKSVISKISKKFEDKKINIVYTNIVMVKKNNLKSVVRNWVSNKKPISHKIKNKNCYKMLLNNGWMPPHTGFFFRKKLFTKIKYNTKYEVSADYDFMIRLLSNVNGIIYLPIKSTKMRIGGKSTKLSKLFKKSYEDLQIIKENDLGGYLTLLKKIFSKFKQFN
jgi:glycosyltransferase